MKNRKGTFCCITFEKGRDTVKAHKKLPELIC